MEQVNYTVTEPTTLQEDYEWERSIELKLSRQGKMIVGIGVGLLTVAFLNGVQAKVVMRLVKANGLIIDRVNTITGVLNTDTPNTTNSNVSYTQPSKTVGIPDVDPEQLEELKRRIEESNYKDGEKF